MFGTGLLRTGSTGDAVRELEQWLIARGFLIERTAAGTTFDTVTDHAVRAFQLSAGIGVDGRVGDGTRAAAESFTQTAGTTGWHPTAHRNVQVTNIGGTYTTDTRRGVLHTTQGHALPNYTSPPHFTIGRNRGNNPVEVWQHYPTTVASRALRHPAGTPETNRHGAIQIEIITMAENAATLATDDADLFQALGELMRWIETNAGVANHANHAFDRVQAYGVNGTVRLSHAEWLATTGWVGHQHVPGNTHWDPGLIDINALLQVTVPAAAVPVAPSPAPTAPPSNQSHTTFTLPASDTLPVVAGRPRARAVHVQLSNAFPSLVLAVETAGLPYFEVVLATDRSLFHPDRSGARHAANFYASRADGLRDAARSKGRFVAPVPVVRAFAEANPAGGQIFYTVVGYADDAGVAATPMADAAALVSAAPSVTMLPGFRGHTEVESLGVPLRLLRTGGARQLSVGSSPTLEVATALPATPTTARTVADDAGEGEDGYVHRLASEDLVPDFPPAPPPGDTSGGESDALPAAAVPAPDALPAVAVPAPDALPATEVAPPGPSSPPPPDERAALPAAAVPAPGADAVPSPTLDALPAAGAMASLTDYDDGFGDWSGSHGDHALATALDSTFPPSAPRPAALEDAEAPALPADEEFDDPGWAGDEYAAATPAAPSPGPGAPGATRPGAVRLTPPQKRVIIETYVGADSELYSARNPDGEYGGSAGTDHPAYQRYHLGLTFGLAGFSQDSGELGQLVSLMEQRDGARFGEIFGPSAASMVDVLNSPGPLAKDTDDGFSARLAPVDGSRLWEEPWLGRFATAGEHRPFRGAQIELAAGLYLDPTLRFATDIGLATQRGLAIVFDRAAHRGVRGGMHWIIETVGALQSPQLQQEALRTLGFESVEAFQRSQPDLLVDDQFGPLTHAAAMAVLRAGHERGAPSPVPMLSYQQMLDAIGERATGQPWGDRIVRLVGSADIADSLPPEGGE